MQKNFKSKILQAIRIAVRLGAGTHLNTAGHMERALIRAKIATIRRTDTRMKLPSKINWEVVRTTANDGSGRKTH